MAGQNASLKHQHKYSIHSIPFSFKEITVDSVDFSLIMDCRSPLDRCWRLCPWTGRLLGSWLRCSLRRTYHLRNGTPHDKKHVLKTVCLGFSLQTYLQCRQFFVRAYIYIYICIYIYIYIYISADPGRRKGERVREKDVLHCYYYYYSYLWVSEVTLGRLFRPSLPWCFPIRELSFE